MTQSPIATVLKPLSLAISLMLGLGLAACSKNEPAAPAVPAETAAQQQAAAAQAAAAAAAAQQQAAQLASLSAEELKKRGNQALKEQRLYAPAGDNAMEYFLALRKKSAKPDPSGESALIDLQPYAVIAAEQAITRDDFVEAERLRSLIEATDPQAPALPRIADAIAKGKVAAAQKLTQAATLADQQKAAADAKAKADQLAAAQAAAAQALAAQKPAAPAPAPVVAAPPPAPKPVVAAPPPPPAAPARSAELVAVSTPQPAFPQEALRDGTAGEVVASYTVNADGSVSNVSIVSARPRGVFEHTVQSTVKRWKYQPTDKPQTVTRTFSFSP